MGMLKHRVEMLLVIKYSTCKFRFVMTMQKYFLNIVMPQTEVSFFFASFIASITSYVIFLTSFCQEGSESSVITCHIVCIKTIILYVCNLFKTRMRFFINQKMSHMSEKVRFKQYKYPISPKTRIANDWWCSWMWGWPPLIP